MATLETTIGMRKVLRSRYDDVLVKVPEALKGEGFGVLTEIDVQETLKKKLGVEFRRYKILGACNPPIAHQALAADLGVGVLLPCNVAVYEDETGGTIVHVVDPLQTIAARGGPELEGIARTVREKLERVLEKLE